MNRIECISLEITETGVPSVSTVNLVVRSRDAL